MINLFPNVIIFFDIIMLHKKLFFEINQKQITRQYIILLCEFIQILSFGEKCCKELKIFDQDDKTS